MSITEFFDSTLGNLMKTRTTLVPIFTVNAVEMSHTVSIAGLPKKSCSKFQKPTNVTERF